jgi:putative phosphotransacetylase
MTKNIDPKKIPLEISARHIHLTREDIDKLFGEGYQLKVLKELSQPGMFAAEELVTIFHYKFDKDKKTSEEILIPNVRIVGPERDYTQFEISFTGARKLGIVPPIRESGKVEGSPGFKIIGPKCCVTKKEGMIVAKRHIHITPRQAQVLNVQDGTDIQIKAGVGGERELIFDKVRVRVKDTYDLAIHIDTDEANSAGLQTCTFGELVN